VYAEDAIMQPGANEGACTIYPLPVVGWHRGIPRFEEKFASGVAEGRAYRASSVAFVPWLGDTALEVTGWGIASVSMDVLWDHQEG